MLICPDCQLPITDSKPFFCSACDWHGQTVAGVHSFLSSSDQNDALFNSYTDNYDEIASDDLSQAILDERYIDNQATNMVGYIHNIPGAEICDIGSGKGFLVRRLVKAGAKSVMAVDITTEYFDTFIDDERVTPIIANAENLPFKEEFDVITSTDVLEHVLNVGSFLISVYEALKPNGMAYIRVPYKEDLLNYAPQRGCKYKFVHLRSFNKDLLRGLFKSAGFEVQKLHLDGFSIQTPQSYINMDRAVSSWLYNKWQARQLKKLEHAADVTLYNSFLAKIMMRPQEVVVVLRKNR